MLRLKLKLKFRLRLRVETLIDSKSGLSKPCSWLHYHGVGQMTHLHGSQQKRGSRGKKQQAPDMLQLPSQSEHGDTVQQGRQQAKEQGSDTPLQPALNAPVIQPPTP